MHETPFSDISVKERENPVKLVCLKKKGTFFLSERFTKEFLLREEIFKKLIKAEKSLPKGYRFLIYECFRSRKNQEKLWETMLILLRRLEPGKKDEEYLLEVGKIIADPRDFGGGHQAAAAVDLTLCSELGEEFDLGGSVQAYGSSRFMDYNLLTKEQRKLRFILKSALSQEDLLNDPEAWWHFCYGDRLWANLMGQKEAFFAPID